MTEHTELTAEQIDVANRGMRIAIDPSYHPLLDEICAQANMGAGGAVEKAIHYPDCWDTTAYPTLADALVEVYGSFKCSNEDNHPTPSTAQAAMPEEPPRLAWNSVRGMVPSDVKFGPMRFVRETDYDKLRVHCLALRGKP